MSFTGSEKPCEKAVRLQHNAFVLLPFLSKLTLGLSFSLLLQNSFLLENLSRS